MAGVTVRGLRELNLLFAAAPREAKRAKDDALRKVAEPVRADAEGLAVSTIPTVGVTWSRMRVGVTRTAVYVAPKARGTRIRSRSRPRFGDMLDERAMTPALNRNQHLIEGRLEDAFDELANRWNRKD